MKATGSEGDGRLKMLFGDSQRKRQSVIKSKKLDRILNTTRRKSWRNATEKDGHAWGNSNAQHANHDFNAVRDVIDG